MANLDRLHPFGFKSTIFDRLMTFEHDNAYGLSLQQLRQSVAIDLEDLLNSRIAQLDEIIDGYELSKRSILQFGIIDFVGLSTANPTDRDKICRSIECSIQSHEPRLKHVRVEMLIEEQNMGSLCLSIHAYLNIHPIFEPVIFDAVLKPTTQQYMISART